MAKTSQKVRQQRGSKYKTTELQPVQAVRPPARVSAQVRALPHLLREIAHEGMIPGLTKSSW